GQRGIHAGKLAVAPGIPVRIGRLEEAGHGRRRGIGPRIVCRQLHPYVGAEGREPKRPEFVFGRSAACAQQENGGTGRQQAAGPLCRAHDTGRAIRRSSTSKNSAATSIPPSLWSSRIPVGLVTLISVR